MWDHEEFSLASGLPSPTSAADDGSTLFGWFIGTIPESDSSAVCVTGVRPCAFPVRPGSHWTQALRRSPGSRACSFSTCLGSSTTQGRNGNSRLSLPHVWPSPYVHRVGAPNFPFSKLILPAR